MNPFRGIVTLTLLVAALGAPGGAAAIDPFHKIPELNYYEWTAVAPIVVSGESQGELGRYLVFRVDRVLRGAGRVEPGKDVLLDLKSANRDRRRADYPEPLKLTFGVDFIVLLQPSIEGKDGLVVHPLARGVLSARELPEESQQGILDAVAMFIDVQDQKNDRITWSRMGTMLDETNPLVLVTALEQLAKFRRGTPDHLLSLRPLFDHPIAAIREAAARVAGQIVERNVGHGEPLPEEEALLAELIGLARRDDTVEPRVAATAALAAFGIERVEPVLEEIAASDPDQDVRYSAERLLLQYRKDQEAKARRPGLRPVSN